MNYLEYFQGDSPFGNVPVRRNEAYQPIYTIFLGAEGDQLLSQVVDLFEAQVIGGLGVCVEDAAGLLKLRIIHGIRRYPGTLLQPSANQGNTFGYIDDIEGGLCELVQVNAAMLAKAAASRVFFLIEHNRATWPRTYTRSMFQPSLKEGPTLRCYRLTKFSFSPLNFPPLY